MTTTRDRRVEFVSMVVLLAGATALPGQCGSTWLPGDSIPGPSGPVAAVSAWDPDGAGPAMELLVVGGDFTTVGPVVADHVAAWDPVTATWSALGAGVSGTPHAFLAMPNGDLIVAGSLTAAGGNPVANIARWDGASWSPLGAGTNGDVNALALLQNGDLVAGGSFTTAGGVSAGNIARWDGAAWSPLGAGMVGPGGVLALATMANGNLIAGGTGFVASWNGSAWTQIGTGMSGGPLFFPAVLALAVLPSGVLVAGGGFDTIGGAFAQNLAQWNGSSWSPMGAGTPYVTVALASPANGQLVAVQHYLQVSHPLLHFIRQWNGTSWQLIGQVQGSGFSLAALGNGDLVLGNRISGGPTPYLSRWDGSTWSGFGAGMSPGSYVATAKTLGDGSVVVGGVFDTIRTVSARNIARWDGTTWSAFGGGIPGNVNAIAELPNGNLVAAGRFYWGGLTPVNIARWDGSIWTPLSSQTNGDIKALTVLHNGDLIAGGTFTSIDGTSAEHVARFDGTAWHALGDGLGPVNFEVSALAVLQNGDLVAGGNFLLSGTTSVQFTARWDGTSWSQLGASTDGRVSCLLALRDGRLVAGGDFGTAGGNPASNIAAWHGTAWSPLHTGMGPGPFVSHVRALCELPTGDLVAAGDFTSAGSVAANNIARWNGTTWSAFGSGTNHQVYALAAREQGDITVGGLFSIAGGTAASYLAFVVPDCPARATVSGTGCNSSAGPIQLVADTLPWLGGTFRSTVSGIVPGALAFGALGFTSPGYALSLVHPAGGVGCHQYAGTDAITLLVASGSQASCEFALPPDPAYAGLVLYHQVLQIEFTPSYQLTLITSSNGLVLTTGTW